MRRIQTLMMTGLLCVPIACDREPSDEKEAGPAGEEDSPADAHEIGVEDPHTDTQEKTPKFDRGTPIDVTASGEARAQSIGGLQAAVPTQWLKQESTSDANVAQFKLPGPGGDAQLTVVRTPAGAGGVEGNLERWKKEFTPPQGKTLDEVANVQKFKAGDLEITLLDIQGRYVAAVHPGASEQYDEPDFRMLGAVVEGAANPFVLKVVGPADTLDVWAVPFRTMLEGVTKG